MNEELVAPCGMDCSVCARHLALEHRVKEQGIKIPYCTCCRLGGRKCAYLRKSCDLLLNDKVRYCYECPEFPCHRLKQIDKRYRTFYRTSFIENLEFIRDRSIGDFLLKEEEKWRCPVCGGRICCHNGVCFSCGLDTLKKRKKMFRWEDT